MLFESGGVGAIEACVETGSGEGKEGGVGGFYQWVKQKR